MNRRLMYGVVVAVGAVLGSGCSSSNSSSGDGGSGTFGVTPSTDLLSTVPAAGGTWTVAWRMGVANENGDQGQIITVHKGDSVIWKSTDSQPHTVAQTNANEPGPFPVTPATFSTQSAPITFPNAGTWGYYCSIHGASSMAGTITVQ